MAFETREQVLEKVLAQKRPHCPHCGQEMNIWEVPPITCGDGLGWGAPFLIAKVGCGSGFQPRLTRCLSHL